MHSICSAPMDQALTHQVDSLGDLLEGWFDDDIEPYSARGIDWVKGLLDHLVDGFHVPVPYLYPTPQGLVRAGWVSARWDVIADIDVARHAVGVFARRLSTHEVHERQLSLEVPGAEGVLGRFVAGHTR